MINSLTGTVAKSTGSWYKVLTVDGSEFNARLKGKFRLQGKVLTNPIAVGDEVEMEFESQGNYVINKILQRKNYLLRKSTKLSSRYQLVAANIDQAILIATLVKPKTSMGFIDRFLITCESFGIPALLIFNKADLLTENEQRQLEEIVYIYSKMGYKTFTTSLLDKVLPKEIATKFNNSTTLVFGHSGVGKSTLINQLIPGSNQQVAQISEYHGKGRHTTTFARMFVSTQGRRIIDTPGVKEFGMEPMEAWKLSHYFRDFAPYRTSCKFNNCLHTDEPICGVVEAVSEGNLSESRYKSYLSMLEEMDI